MTDPSSVKRLRYFDRQFLREPDFTAEQEYHLRMRRLHNRTLHTWGIAEGLALSAPSGARQVTVSAGSAIDSAGREIVLSANTPTVDLSDRAGKTLFVTIAYAEQEDDARTEGGVTGFSRTREAPRIGVREDSPSPPGVELILGRVVVDGAGTVSAINEGDAVNRRRNAGVVTGDLEARSLTLTNPAVDRSAWPRLSLVTATPRQVDLQGSLRVTGDIAVDGRVDGRDLSVDGTNLDQHLANRSNPHQVTAAQLGALLSLDGVSNPGGNVDLVQGGGITITPDDANNRITISETHSARTDNPHQVTAAQVGALALTGGNINGRVEMRHGTGANFPSLTVMHGAANASWGLVSYVVPVLGTTPGGRGSALMGIADLPNVHGVYARAAAGTHALWVEGTANFTGAKTGYVVDTFVNGSGERLHTGDVVRLKGTPVVRFQGEDNKIPVVEVTLADAEHQGLVIGVVDREAIPSGEAPDRRVEPEDSSFIEDGGELFVVTLGVYAHCKVDAGPGAIAAGDLLVPSPNPGHAQKASDPRVGGVIGKALEPLESGTGSIAVFVNIQ